MNLFLRMCAIVLAGALMAPHAGAQTMVETAARWGLLGTWMADCRQPPDIRNTQDTYVGRSGQLVLERDLGPQYARDSTAITGVTVQPNGTIELIEYYGNIQPPQTRRTTLTKDGNNRIRMWANVNLNTGAYSVRDGMLTAAGRPTPWQGRCN